MTPADAASFAWGNLRRRKGRTALTAAGVIIGVAALVLMVSLGLGVKRQLLRLFETEDELRTLRVRRVKADNAKRGMGPFAAFQVGGQIVPLTDKDLEEMQRIPGVQLALPDLQMILRLSIDLPEAADFYPVAGVAPEEEARYPGILVAGRMWSSPGERGCLLPTAFLELQINRKPEEVVGRKITFGAVADGEATQDLEFTVVGVFDSERVGLFGRQALLPLERAKEVRRATKGGLSWIPYKEGSYGGGVVRVADPREVEGVKARLKNSGYTVFGASDLIESINLVFLIVEGFMACIGAIGLIVSLFGIANTMAMAVLERTREIGIMKALGARNREIGRVFLLEAAAIGAVGGGVGLGMAWLSGLLLNALARKVFEFPDRVSLFHVSLWLAAGSVAFSVFVSVAAGYLPARRAARLDPVAALRYE